METPRREFIKDSAALVAAAGIGTALPALAQQSPEPNSGPVPPLPSLPTVRKGDMQYKMLGKTGEQVSIVGLGGFHIGKQKEESESIRIIRTAIDRGINFMDNCWDYNEGVSEVRMGRALKDGYRKKVFLMTKIDGRTKEAAARQIDESLVRLQTDHLDLLQFHEILRMEDPDRIFAKNGAMEAVMAAKQAGKIRYIGFTGHKDPLVHLRMLEVADKHGFHFDTAQMPINLMDAHFRSFTLNVVPVLLQKQVGVLGMKTFGDPYILNYIQQQGGATPIEMLHYSMTMPTSVVITGIDSLQILDQALEAAKTYKPLSAEKIASLRALTQVAAQTGEYELFKTTNHFDSTAKDPKLLG